MSFKFGKKWELATSILLSPEDFFEKIKKQEKIKPVFIYLVIFTIIGSFLTLLGNIVFRPIVLAAVSSFFKTQTPSESITFASAIPFLVSNIAFSLVFSFLFAWVLHIWNRIFGGKGNYQRSYQIYVYSSTPSLLLGWIPLVSIFAWIYSVYLMILGSIELHHLPRRKAILIYAIPYGVLTILWVVGMILTFFVFTRNG